MAESTERIWHQRVAEPTEVYHLRVSQTTTTTSRLITESYSRWNRPGATPDPWSWRWETI